MTDTGEAVVTVVFTGFVAVTIALIAVQLLNGSTGVEGITSALGIRALDSSVGAIVLLVALGLPSAGLIIGSLYGRAH
jgi:hypothetical protein